MTETATQTLPSAPRLDPMAAGALWGLGAATLWSGWWVMTRLGITASLPGSDLAALRFGVAGVVMLPVLMHHWRSLRTASPLLIAVLTRVPARLTPWSQARVSASPPPATAAH